MDVDTPHRIGSADMPRIPLTAEGQLAAARAAGHELTIETGESRPDYADRDGGTRYRVVCSCGWVSNWRGSRSGVTGRVALHLGQVLAEASD